MNYISNHPSYVNADLICIPEAVLQQPVWGELNLSGNEIQEVDQKIAFLSIDKLLLSNNPLSKFPSVVFDIKGLKELHIKDVNFKNIPSEIDKLKDSLEVLDLSNCQLEALPKEIGSLTNLKVLRLENNRLHQLPPELANLKKLEKLELAFNEFEEFPEAIIGMIALKVAHLGHNQISSIPAQIDELSELETLGMTNNKLKRIPGEIGNLKNIQKLILSFNQIQELPQQIGKLKSLKEVLLRHNQLSYLPIEINRLSKDLLLNIEDNPLNGLDSAQNDQPNKPLCSTCDIVCIPIKDEITKEKVLSKRQKIFARTILCAAHV